jgi:hypothetical protein
MHTKLHYFRSDIFVIVIFRNALIHYFTPYNGAALIGGAGCGGSEAGA